MGKIKPSAKKANSAQRAARALEVVEWLLAGCATWQIRARIRSCQTVRGSVWCLEEGEQELTDSAIAKYVSLARAQITASVRECREDAVARHLAIRVDLFRVSRETGDIKTALACAKDEAELLGIYPAKRSEVSFPGGANPEDLPDAILRKLAGAPIDPTVSGVGQIDQSARGDSRGILDDSVACTGRGDADAEQTALSTDGGCADES